MWTYWLATSWTAPRIADDGFNLPNHAGFEAGASVRRVDCRVKVWKRLKKTLQRCEEG
jgi:hypothetical protein